MDICSHRRLAGPIASKRNPGLADEAYPGFRFAHPGCLLACARMNA
jgi:hypothetical protein